MNYLDEEQHERAIWCIANINDKLAAIDKELLNERAYKSYILEKLENIEWDFTCLKNMCKTEEE